MAVLGFQLVFSLVMFSFLHKLAPFYSFARWLLCKSLCRFLHPSEDELKAMAGIPQGGGKGKGKRNEWKKQPNGTKTESFTIPRSTPIELSTAPVEALDVVQLHFFTDFKWLMDFCFSASIVYILTETYLTMFPGRNEFNISILWCLLAIWFCIRVLISQTAVYFRTEDGGERILCITFGFFYLVAAMGILIVDDNMLELGLNAGYDNFSGNAISFLEQQGIESHGPVSLLTFKIVLAFISSFIGALLTFSGLRYAKLHLDALRYSSDNKPLQALLQLNLLLPLLIVLLWVKPLGRDIVCGKNWQVVKALMDEKKFESVRLLIFVILILLRLVLFRTHMQAHLNLAYEKVKDLRKESGRISNEELQHMVASVFYYLCVVALQYITPVLFLTFLVMLLKTLGDYSWTDFLGDTFSQKWLSQISFPVANITSQSSDSFNITGDSISEATAQLTWAMGNMRNIFTFTWYRGILSYLTWWSCAAWFTSTAFGLAYYGKLSAA